MRKDLAGLINLPGLFLYAEFLTTFGLQYINLTICKIILTGPSGCSTQEWED